ncbi:MAG: DUF883 domain-containing protein [Burkholderiales bacterium]|nr:DUF883 domain-containing protein [Burkholderiales bacterium]
MNSVEVNREKLVADMRVVISDAEELLRATAGQAGEKISAARARIQDSIEVAKGKLAEVGELGVQRAKASARATDEYVHEHPWQSVGIAALAGLVVGILIGRR